MGANAELHLQLLRKGPQTLTFLTLTETSSSSSSPLSHSPSVFAVIRASQQASFPQSKRAVCPTLPLLLYLFPPSLFAVVSVPAFHSSLSLSPSLFHCVNSPCSLLTLKNSLKLVCCLKICRSSIFPTSMTHLSAACPSFVCCTNPTWFLFSLSFRPRSDKKNM